MWARTQYQTALAEVLHESGNQRTFVSRIHSEKLKCPVLDNEELSVFTFGNARRPSRFNCRRVSFDLRSQFNETAITIESLEVHKISTVTSHKIENDLQAQFRNKETMYADLAPDGLLKSGCSHRIMCLLANHHRKNQTSQRPTDSN